MKVKQVTLVWVIFIFVMMGVKTGWGGEDKEARESDGSRKSTEEFKEEDWNASEWMEYLRKELAEREGGVKSTQLSSNIYSEMTANVGNMACRLHYKNAVNRCLGHDTVSTPEQLYNLCSVMSYTPESVFSCAEDYLCFLFRCDLQTLQTVNETLNCQGNPLGPLGCPVVHNEYYEKFINQCPGSEVFNPLILMVIGGELQPPPDEDLKANMMCIFSHFLQRYL